MDFTRGEGGGGARSWRWHWYVYIEMVITAIQTESRCVSKQELYADANAFKFFPLLL